MAAGIGRMQLSIFDQRGNKGSVLEHMTIDDAQTLAQAGTAIGTFATAFHAVSGAGIRDGSFNLLNTGVAQAAAADSDISSGALFQFDNATDITRSSVWTPSFLSSAIAGGEPDPTDAGVIAWVALLHAAILGGKFANSHYVVNRNMVQSFLADRRRPRR